MSLNFLYGGNNDGSVQTTRYMQGTCIDERNKHGDGNVMIWGGITFNAKTPIHIVQVNLRGAATFLGRGGGKFSKKGTLP